MCHFNYSSQETWIGIIVTNVSDKNGYYYYHVPVVIKCFVTYNGGY